MSGEHSQPEQPVTPVPAATVLLLKQAGSEIEVFLQRRSPNARFVGGVYVFPGGKIDDDDRLIPYESMKLPSDDDPAMAQAGGVQALVAAARECFEEAGILLAYNDQGQLLRWEDQTVHERFNEHRRQLNAKELLFSELVLREGLTLALDRLVYLSHWITPAQSPMRFDTRFFVTTMPANQVTSDDGYEAIHSFWLSPKRALQLWHRGEIELILPTVRSLEQILEFDRVEEALAYYRQQSQFLSDEARLLSLNGQREEN